MNELNNLEEQKLSSRDEILDRVRKFYPLDPSDPNSECRYDYSNVPTLSGNQTIEPYCKKHKTYFPVNSKEHVNGRTRGCPECKLEIAKIKKQREVSNFYDKAKSIWKDKETGQPLYDYNVEGLIKYSGLNQPFEFYCHRKDKDGEVHGKQYVKQAKKHIDKVRGQGCQNCRIENGGSLYNTRVNYTREDFAKLLKEKIESLGIPAWWYDFSSLQYKSISTPASIVCNEHKLTKETIEANTLIERNPLCKECERIVGERWYKQQLQEKYGNQFVLVSNYYEVDKPVVIACTSHRPYHKIELDNAGSAIKPSAGNMKYGIKCDECKRKYYAGEFLKTAKEKHSIVKADGGEKSKYSYPEGIKGYKGATEKIMIKCKAKGHIFWQRPSDHKRGQGCPICRESKGEADTFNILSQLKKQNGEPFTVYRENDAKFEKLRGKRNLLPFDFYLPELKIVIEYDGEQHFEPIFGKISKQENYNRLYGADDMKNDFANSNDEGIRLIRIPYTLKGDAIKGPLLDAIKKLSKRKKYTPGKNNVIRLGDYPEREAPKEPELPKQKVDLTKPIRRPVRTNETKLSFENILSEKLMDMVPVPIYHHTTEDRALSIMNSNMLLGTKPFEEIINLDPTLKHSKHKMMVSFSRDKNFIPDASIGNSGDGPRVSPDMLKVIFVVDRNRLKTRYRVLPFDYSRLADKAWADEVPRTHKNPEVEERVLTDRIFPLRQYVKDIIYTGSNPEVQKKIDEYLSGIK